MSSLSLQLAEVTAIAAVARVSAIRVNFTRRSVRTILLLTLTDTPNAIVEIVAMISIASSSRQEIGPVETLPKHRPDNVIRLFQVSQPPNMCWAGLCSSVDIEITCETSRLSAVDIDF